MVQITREDKRKVYSFLLEEGVLVVKQVQILTKGLQQLQARGYPGA